MKNKRLKFNSGELVYYKDFDKLNTQTKFSTDKYGKINYNINLFFNLFYTVTF